jgi:hypothetical protein
MPSMTRTQKMLSVGAAIALVASVTVAAAFHRSTVTQSIMVDKCRSSATGHSMASIEVIADSSDLSSAFVVFKLISICPDSGLLQTQRKACPLASVTWPVELVLKKDDGSPAASAVFTHPGSGPTTEVGITTTDT